AQYLQGKLPDFMIPQLWVELESMPLTPNGKIDKKALPDPDASELLTNEYVAPTNEMEAKLAGIWQELLPVERIGIHDNFFELGGHSLLAMRVISAIRRELEVELAIKALFVNPTIASLAVHLQGEQKTSVLPAIQAVKERPEDIPLSFSQERLWFIDRLEGSVQYHIPIVLKLKGNLNKQALKNALQTIIDRHEVLRTVIIEKDGKAYQHIKEQATLELPILNGAAQDEYSLQLQIEHLVSEPFDLEKDNMLRAGLIQLNEQEHLLIVTMHHIASDGWSIPVIIKEVADLYKAYENGRQPTLAPLKLQYSDYAQWQQNYLQGETLKKKLAYWKQKLDGVAPLQLPTDHPRPAIQTINGNNAEFRIDKELEESLVALSQQNGATLFMTLLAAFKVMLYRYSGQQDISVGTSIANRSHQELSDLVGFFVNTLALRSEVNGEDSFVALLQQVKETMLEAYEQQDVPFEKVVDAVVRERDMSRSPLFQLMFVLQNIPEIQPVQLGDIEFETVAFEQHISKFEMSFTLSQSINGLHGTVQYNTDLYNAGTIGRMIAHYSELLKAVVTAPRKAIGSLPMLTAPEEQKLLNDFNNTTVPYPKDKSIVDLFVEQVSRTPIATAVVFEEDKLTYTELHERSNQLAHYLRSRNVKKETLVPIILDRSLDMIIAILGILKAGAAYVPIDPEYPQDRISYMLEDTAAKLVLSSKASLSKLATTSGIDIIEIDTEWKNISQESVNNLETKPAADDLAYVIYTSGSTGKPKGVMIEHCSVINLLLSISGTVDFKAESIFLSVTTYSFDISYLEFYMPLILGGKLIVLPRQITTNGFRLAEKISHYAPTHMQATPSTWHLLLEAGWKNQEAIKMLVGGEAVKNELKNVLCELGDVWNVYGPTETTIWSTIKKLQPDQKVLIGTPIANTIIQIVSKDGQLAPVGIPGEICIGGAGLARGYLNRPELTAEKFINNRFANDGSKIYKTGDLGCWLADGNIDCLGRIDDQVKVRGYRIELGEIETVLVQSGLVNKAVVIAKDDNQGDKHLVAYVVAGEKFDKQALANYLHGKLPEFMVPAVWIELETLPLTPNGKIDKKALPNPATVEFLSNEYTPPRNEVEVKLAEIWQELLRVDRIGVHDNFFELGGHSLLAMRVISAIRRELETELAIKALFVNPTIALLALHLKGEQKTLALPTIQAVKERPENVPLSFGQERLWFIDRLEGSVPYHLPSVLRLKGKLNKAGLAHALQTIVNRHEVLRTVIREYEGKASQYIINENEWELNIVDGLIYKENPDALKSYIHQLSIKPFDLSKDHMIHATLIALDGEDHVVVMVMHHIASDAWSTSILVKEVVELYSSYEQNRSSNLTPVQLQYADYALWQRNYLQGEILDKKIGYWKDKLRDVAALQLPVDHTRPSVQKSHGASLDFKIDKELSAELELLCQQEGTTIYMTLLAAFN
ncbi:MAG: amino acid adenylation domain-containing protein, partial [Ferruginibacter sp.]